VILMIWILFARSHRIILRINSFWTPDKTWKVNLNLGLIPDRLNWGLRLRLWLWFWFIEVWEIEIVSEAARSESQWR
jgi:hypothetical protein